MEGIQEWKRDFQKVAGKPVTEVAVLQVWSHIVSGWVVASVHANKAIAEQEASLRGYTRWSVSEFAVMGGE